MKTMFSQSAKIKELSPVAADLGTTSRPFKSVRLRRGLHFGQHRQQPVRDRNCVGPSRSAFGHGKSDGFGFKVNTVQRDSGFFEPASGMQGNLKADSHPLRNVRHRQGSSHSGNVLFRKNGFSINRRLAGSEIHHGHGGHVAKQSALSVNPFKNLDVLKGLVSADIGSVGSGGGGSPRNVFHGRGRGKVGKSNSIFVHESGQVSPGVSVIDFGVGGNLMLVKKALNPSCVGHSSVAFAHGKLGGFLNGFCPVQGVVGSVAGGLGFPNAIGVFVADPIPLAVASFKNRGHGTSVSNRLKIGKN